MAPITRSDNVIVLKYIIVILLTEALSTTSDISPFCSCFATAGILNVSNFLTLDLPAYSAIMQLIVKDGSHDHQLNII
eukprot:10924969-Ditylum_brightwellii.AAC.1